MTSPSEPPDPAPEAFDLAAERSPWSRRHREIERRGIARHIPREHELRQLLYGPGRVVKHPLAALMVEKDMGPARHALSQRTVAGTMEIVFQAGPVAMPRALGGPGGPATGASGPGPGIAPGPPSEPPDGA